MKLLVAGGTGLLGGAIAAAAEQAGHDVTVLSRSRPRDPRFPWVTGDVTRPETLPAAMAGFDAVADAVQFPNSPIEDPKKGYTFERIDLGGTRALADAARAAGVGLFVGLSGAHAAPDAPYHWLRYKFAEEEHIRGTGVPFVVFRPSWVYGPGDVSLNRFLGFTRFLPFVPVIGSGKTRVTPLFLRDLGRHVAAALTNEAARDGVFDIGGPATMTMDEVIRTALRVAGKRRFLLHQPAGLMKAVAGVAQHIPGRPLTPGAVDFITMDGDVDTARLREVFELPLTPLAEGLATYLGGARE